MPPSSHPHFSIITIYPGSGDVSDPLFCSVASLADQEETTNEHILQQTGEAINLWNKLSREVGLSKRTSHYTLRLLEEKNVGFLEALHRGMHRANGDVISFLQPGQQYLPGALALVAKEFEAHPDLDVVITGSITADKQIGLASAPIIPSLEYLWTCEPSLPTHALFFRASLLQDGLTPEPRYGEQMITEWMLRLLQAGKKIRMLSTPTTAVSDATALRLEKKGDALTSAPPLMKFLKPWWQWRHNNALKKAQQQLPSSAACSIYQPHSLQERLLMK